jgi:predicted O-methyltransferase YrrM
MNVIKRTAKSFLRPLIFRYPPIGLQPERLQYWLRTLIETADVGGAVLEVGCSVGGTAAFSSRMLRNLNIDKRYVCVDTFGGFVEDQFKDDVALGNVPSNRGIFSANSLSLTRQILNQHGANHVELVQGDIVTLADSKLPGAISAALLDVDLALPIYEGLKKLYPRLAAGGAILIDDCPPNYDWQARQGYERFCAEFGLTPQYAYGMGIIARPR